MRLPSSIRSQVDPAAITKVTRLFNNTLGDILIELVQNARRAGASLIDLATAEIEGATWITVSDDGAGIQDPCVILSLGRSGWEETLAAREDPAGMGVFSLAGRYVEVRSRSRGASQGWRVEITPEAWESGEPMAVTPCDHGLGTSFRLELDAVSAKSIEQTARSVASYCPVPIRFNGTLLPQRDWLAGAEAVIEQDGVRIGLFRDARAVRQTGRINFHGVVVACSLPTVSEQDRHWWVKIDIVDAPELQLVLPARKEMVENSALGDLRQSVIRAIYRRIQSLGEHRLPYKCWCEARDLGVDLPEARQLLDPWYPSQADCNGGSARNERKLGANPILVCDLGPPIEQCADFAVAQDDRFATRLAQPVPAMEGYSWYDALERITDMRFEIEKDGEIRRFDATELPAVTSGVVDRLDLVVELAGPEAETIVIPAPVAILYDDSIVWDFEEAAIVLASPDAVSPPELVELLEGACFCSSDDREADSWDTQNSRFLLDAREVAMRLLFGDDAAIIERLRAILADRVQWFVPEERQFTAVIARNALDIQIGPSKAG